MLSQTQHVATALWAGIAGGAAAGFVARDGLGLGQPLVALAWALGAAIPALALARSGALPRPRRARARRRPPARGGSERGQATIEFAALALLAALLLGALAAASHRFDGRSFGGFLAFHLACAIKRDCHRGEDLLEHAYGRRDAHLVRELAPNLVYEPGERQLPVDWRDCRRAACAEAPDERDLDVHLTDAGERATAFTRTTGTPPAGRGSRAAATPATFRSATSCAAEPGGSSRARCWCRRPRAPGPAGCRCCPATISRSAPRPARVSG